MTLLRVVAESNVVSACGRSRNQKAAWAGNLKQRMAAITSQTENYAMQLTRNNWKNFCDRMQGSLGTDRTWALLRTLIDPNQTKATISKTLLKILRQTLGDEAAIIEVLRIAYLGAGATPSYKDYPRAETTELDRDITEQ
ncbi:hypothetical protein HPB48_016749 [Haemaphysalis longicornis]|uniref:Uncharacterized protein n=1 Tax=Haemaphysalis longicornis TaxID=44386 RepID=A0A9J6G0X8_HAELO|nr:hypothetical protein HPB48_016749 [Haemaphysalis longicornis]